ncbi:MAG: hypothetical protein A2V88_13020 [Elusimicrobia bacterium RBG_16_66_12]|nr:MAG: hypothetical protein A2V88_13020 [Elusimicrobia bacterium RBG_16_66_12]
MTEAKGRRSRAATVWAVVALIAAGAAGLGLYLPWLRTDSGIIGIPGGRVLNEVSGWELTAGVVALVAVAVAAFLALVWLAYARTLPLVAAGLILAGGTIVVAVASVLAAPTDRFVDWAASNAANTETTSEEIRALLPRFFESNDVTVSAEPGLYLTLAGGAVVLLAGLGGLIVSRHRSRNRGEPQVHAADDRVEASADASNPPDDGPSQVVPPLVADEPAPEGASLTSSDEEAPSTEPEERSGDASAPGSDADGWR